MREDLRTVSVRSLVVLPGGRRSSLITRFTRTRRRSREERLELIERLARDERRRRQSSEHVPDVGLEWRRRF
jgi:hypothetical protein